ncbi:MAG: DMT family transporter [Planctomycetaceae bacterium]|jgi:drug/metabolite transporter (DMT)-like permease|nr:DMT family transporter [Planctomycetaceae bacterium]
MGMGEWCALTAALLWTFSSMLWGKIRLTPTVLNFAKNWVGCGLLLTHVLVVSLIWQTWPNWGNWQSALWLSLSAVIGIAIGDTFYFRSIQILGPRLALVMATTAPLFGATIGLVVFGEILPWFGWTGVGLTLLGVYVVVSDRRSRVEAPGLFQGAVVEGALCGLGGAICQAIGGGLSKQATKDCGELEAAAIRTTVALIATLAYIALRGKLGESWRASMRLEHLKKIVPAAGLGTWLGIWLSQIAFNQAPLAIALTLMSTSPLFAIPIVHFYFGHRATKIAIIGSLIAVAGVYLVSQASVQ